VKTRTTEAKSRTGELGQALLAALLTLLLVSVTGALLAGALELKLRMARQAARSVRVVALTDAACATALSELSRSQGSQPLVEEELEGGVLYYRFQWLGSGQYRVQAGASYGGVERWLEAQAKVSGSTVEVQSWQRVAHGPRASL
jgi:hypothetical protein